MRSFTTSTLLLRNENMKMMIHIINSFILAVDNV
jgi:hypothetical protein